jgi:hypothetical protein
MAASKRRGRKMAGVGTRAGTSRIAGAILVAATVLLVGLVGASGASAEPNDSMAEAQGPMTGSLSGAVDTANDVDWYLIYAQAHTQLDAAITSLGAEEHCFEWTLLLKNADGELLSDAHAHFNEADHIRYTLGSAGTYYLEVSGFLCDAPGSYRIDLSASPALLTRPPRRKHHPHHHHHRHHHHRHGR